MSEQKIRITIGSEADAHDVPLSEFAHIVKSSHALLENVAKTVLGKGHDCKFLLSDLSHNSPVSMDITPDSVTLPAAAQEITGRLREDGDILGRGNGVKLPAKSLKLWRDLASLCTKNGIGGLMIESVNGVSVDRIVQIDESTMESVKRISVSGGNILADEVEYKTSVVGKVEVLNLHDSHLKLYPRVKRWKPVKVYFEENLRDEIIKCVGKYAEISGEGNRRSGDVLPYEMRMDRIRKLPDKKDIPKLSEMRGIAPNITGGKSVQEYMDDIRKEWD